MSSFTTRKNIIYLSGIVLLAIIILVGSLLNSGTLFKKKKVKFQGQEISAKDVYALMNENKDEPKDFTIIDFRTPGEYNEGHIKGSLWIDYYLKGFKRTLRLMDKNTDYIIYCSKGRMSTNISKKMKKLGFKSVHKIIGGLQSWKEENLPLDYSRQ